MNLKVLRSEKNVMNKHKNYKTECSYNQEKKVLKHLKTGRLESSGNIQK